MKTSTLLVLSLFALSTLNAQNQTQAYVSDKEYDAELSFENGMFNGKYTSYHEEGVVKAEGQFVNNLRVGTWRVYDRDGNEIATRNYNAPFNYEIMEGMVYGESKNVDFGKKNAEGYVDYLKLKEEMIGYLKRIQRVLKPANNALIFDDNRLLEALKLAVENGVDVYSAENDFFNIKIDAEKMDWNVELLEINIKEETFFCSTWSGMETRMLGISPVVCSRNGGEPYTMAWFYWPDLRSHFAKTTVAYEVFDGQVNNLENVFYFRQFASQITEETNMYMKKISDYKKTQEDILKEAYRIEVKLLEIEHDLWVKPWETYEKH
jgi:hypothetical protein